MSWKDAMLPAPDGELPEGYRREGDVVGHEELLDPSQSHFWAGSEFVARSNTPRTTSAVETRMRERHIARLVKEHGIDLSEPVLDLGCADGAIAHHLLSLGAQRLVSTDLLASGVTALDRSIEGEDRDRVLLVVDDMLRLPLPDASFGAVVAWGILSVTGDFEGALKRAWDWLAPGGHLLFAEPLLEQALVYPLIRGDLDEFRRVRSEGTRAGMWDAREDRYTVNPRGFYSERLAGLPGAELLDEGGINMLPSLLLGGLLQDRDTPESELDEIVELMDDPELDRLTLWRQAFWLLRKG